jgi:methyltransferase (TIGR00027 family)
MEVRTRFMDDRVMAAIGRGVRQIVICGAGLDDRALRFRTAGVRFFEVDHPVTQADKTRRLAGMSLGGGGPILVPCDFQDGSVAAALAACGHAAAEPSLYLCEGLLVYLDQQAGHNLLAGLASCAAPASELAVTLATHAADVPTAVVIADANARRRTGAAEPWRTILRADEHLAMLASAGWAVTTVEDLPAASDDVSYARRSILAAASIGA